MFSHTDMDHVLPAQRTVCGLNPPPPPPPHLPLQEVVSSACVNVGGQCWAAVGLDQLCGVMSLPQVLVGLTCRTRESGKVFTERQCLPMRLTRVATRPYQAFHQAKQRTTQR
jgi:hypothetical protein